MDKRKVGNTEQVISAYELKFESGLAKDKSVILVHNGEIEAMFSKDNALDILYLKYKGKNISFLSKNGINAKEGTFPQRFEAGFLYTCGLDNIGGCISDKPTHGSLHHTPSAQVSVDVQDDKVIITGTIKDSALFGKNLALKRRFTITDHDIIIDDVLENLGYSTEEFLLLYHINFGYPFLDESLKIKMDAQKRVGRTEFAKEGINEQFDITAPVDCGDEQCFYNYIENGKVELKNSDLNISATIVYDTKVLPVCVEWKSMVSGDYALGIEPATSIFEGYTTTPINAGEIKRFNVKISLD